MWFCYENQCPTKSQNLSTCASAGKSLFRNHFTFTKKKCEVTLVLSNYCGIDILLLLGNYGLIPIDPLESNKTLIHSIRSSRSIRNSVEEHCLIYYYYFTVDQQLQLDQQLSVLVRSDDQTENPIEIDRLTAADTTENRWYRRNVTFNSTTNSYAVRYFQYIRKDKNNLSMF